MFRLTRRLKPLFFAILCLWVMSVTLFAQGILAVDTWPKPVRDSDAYKQFSNRPYTELSKILYLIDRFGDTEVEILYDGHYYKARFAKTVARWFLFHRYKKESAEQWVQAWCHKSIISGNLIWVKLPDKSLKPARDMLISELKALEAEYAGRQGQAIQDLPAEVMPELPLKLENKEAIAEASVTFDVIPTALGDVPSPDSAVSNADQPSSLVAHKAVAPLDLAAPAAHGPESLPPASSEKE